MEDRPATDKRMDRKRKISLHVSSDMLSLSLSIALSLFLPTTLTYTAHPLTQNQHVCVSVCVLVVLCVYEDRCCSMAMLVVLCSHPHGKRAGVVLKD